MKKLIITLLLAVALISMYGCQSVNGDTHETENTTEQNNVTTTTPGMTKPTSPDTPEVTDYEYEVNDEGGITITKYKGKDKDVIIPEKIDGKNVTVIGRDAFEKNKDIVSVKMPDTVTSIERGAFYECSAETVVLSQNLKSIGAYAFNKCTSLKHIKIPKSVKVMENEAFMESGLETVEFEEGLEIIGEYAFYYTGLKKVTVPGSVKIISSEAFGLCENLKSVTLNEGIVTIADSAFYGAKITEITIPASVENITEMAFFSCYSLEKVIFEGNAPEKYFETDSHVGAPSSIYTVFYREGAKGFTSPAWNGYTSQIIGKTSEMKSYSDFEYYENADSTITIHRYKGDKTAVVIPDKIDGKKITVIGMYAFSRNDNIVSITIPDTVVTLEARSISICTSLTSVVLPKNLETIGATAFLLCTELSDITLPDTLTYIGNSAFSNCTSLKYVKIPRSVTYFGERAFLATGLETVEFENGLEVIGAYAFSFAKLKEVVLPASLKTLSEGAFAGCPLESITLNEGLITIGDNAFESTSLTEIVIPGTVKEITELAFNYCPSLENVKFEGDAPESYISEDEEAHNVSYTVCYHEGASGFTSPEWNGYNTETW